MGTTYHVNLLVAVRPVQCNEKRAIVPMSYLFPHMYCRAYRDIYAQQETEISIQYLKTKAYLNRSILRFINIIVNPFSQAGLIHSSIIPHPPILWGSSSFRSQARFIASFAFDL